jgi:hypothetical protein
LNQTFPTLQAVTLAADSVRSAFGTGISAYTIGESGLGSEREETGEDVEDGRTLALRVEWEEASADETWGEFTGRLGSVEKDWLEVLGE